MTRVSRSAGVEKVNSRDLAQQKGLAWGQLGEQKAKAGDGNLRELRKADGQESSSLVGDQSEFRRMTDPGQVLACPLPSYVGNTSPL